MPDTHARPPANRNRPATEASRKRSLARRIHEIIGVTSVVALLGVISAVFDIGEKIGIGNPVRFVCPFVANELPACSQATKPLPEPAPVPVPSPVTGGYVCRSDGDSSAVDVCHEIDGDQDKLLRCFHLWGSDKLLVEVSARGWVNQIDVLDRRFDATIRLSITRGGVTKTEDTRTYPGKTSARVVAERFVNDTLTRCP